MSSCQRVARPLVRSIHQDRLVFQASANFTRSFSRTTPRHEETTTTTKTPPPSSSSSSSGSAESMQKLEAKAAETVKDSVLMDPNTTTAHWAERKLIRMGQPPIGSRRRRVAIRTSENVPFEQLPYQCFQEAREVLRLDRDEKLEQLRIQIDRLAKLEAQTERTHTQKLRLVSLKKEILKLKVQIDINDPLVKRKYEDGKGDMDKPIYRHLAEQKWRGMPFRVITQRIEQLNIVPDVLPKFEPIHDVQLYFRRKHVEPGEILDSRVTEVPPRLKVQVFNPGTRLVSIVVMDSDVPNAETDSFERRCHYLAVNIPLSPTDPSLPLGQVNKETQLAVPWLPAFSQKGAPYHRLSIFVLEQKLDGGEEKTLDIAKIRELYSGRDGFSLKSFRDKFGLNPVGFNLFRTVWDEGTAGVMERAGMPGADVEFKHKRVHAIKPKRAPQGWEAKRQKPKYRDLWKYSKRIHGLPYGRR